MLFLRNMIVLDNLNFASIVSLLLEKNSVEFIVIFVISEFIFWTILSFFLVQFLPKKYKEYKKEIFVFFTIINIGLLFIGIVLTIIMILFGLSWATHKESKPDYESVHFEDHISEFPIVYSKFQEGILATEAEKSKEFSIDSKIKSLKILYDSKAEGNIGKIKNFLSDSSDETRLYAFALIASFEKELNSLINNLQTKIKEASTKEEKNKHYYELAYTYWQFIYHGVASEKLSGFYTKKIEKTLAVISDQPKAHVLLGKIHIFNKNYEEAEKQFVEAVKLGQPKESVYTFLAEIKFAQKKYDEVSQYISRQLFEVDIRLKPLTKMWIKP